MTRPHHNIFFYYRGPSADLTKQEGERYQQQVEDNSTKALINVLELGGPDVTRSFLGRFAPPLVATEPARFYLQGGPSQVPDGTRLLLGLSVLGQIDGVVAPADGGSRVDAAVFVPGRGLLVIETKVVDDLEGPQLGRHMHRWKIVEAPICVRWADVWRWARDERSKAAEPAAFLLDQFCEYLEILGFAPWAGFRQEDFDFFTNPTLEQRTIVRNRVTGAWERILEELGPADAKLLGVIKSGRFGLQDATAQAQTNRGESVPNLDLQLGAHELQLNLVGWNDPEATPLIAWLETSPGDELRDRLRGFEIILFERRAMTAKSGRPYWQHETEREVQRFDSEALADGRLTYWLADWRALSDPKWLKLAVHVRRTYSRAEVLGEGERIVATLVSDVRRLLPTLRAIKRP